MKAKNAGRFPGSQRQLLKNVQLPAVRWEDEIQFMVEDICRNDYTWTRPNPRYIQAGVYLPSMHGQKSVDMIFFVDTSGSLSDKQLELIMAEIREVIAHFNIRVIVVYWDTNFRDVEIFDKADVLDPDWGLHIAGRGGTNFSGVLDWMDENLADMEVDPRACIFFTDMGCSNYPDREPGLPWIWAHVPSGSNFNTGYLNHKPDWGKYIKIPIFKSAG
jgi:predicted metal-dependent peptidase